VQHCQSEHHVNNLTGGWTDTPLTELGRRQAAAVAARLKGELAGKTFPLYTSDLMRAAQTAGIIGAELGVTPVLVRDLRENNGGEATGKTKEWAEANVDRSNFSLFDWRGFPGAETWREFHARVCACMERLSQKEADSLAVIVTHGGTLSNVVTWWLRLPLDALPELTPFAATPGSVTVLRKSGWGNPVVERLNDVSHLREAGLANGISLD
jgi:probable phosphoglycerate mutase